MMNEDRDLLIKLSDKDKNIILFFIEYLIYINYDFDGYLKFYETSRITYGNKFDNRINLGDFFNFKGIKNDNTYDFDLYITKDYEFCYLCRGDSRDIDKLLDYITNHVDYNKYLLKKKLDRELENKSVTKKVKI